MSGAKDAPRAMNFPTRHVLLTASALTKDTNFTKPVSRFVLVLTTALRPLGFHGLAAAAVFAALLALPCLRKTCCSSSGTVGLLPYAMMACTTEPSPLPNPEYTAAQYSDFYLQRPEPPRDWEYIADLVIQDIAPTLSSLTPIQMCEVIHNLTDVGHNEGCSLCVKTVLFPGFRQDGVNLLVEDERGDRMHLVLNHYVQQSEAPEVLKGAKLCGWCGVI